MRRDKFATALMVLGMATIATGSIAQQRPAVVSDIPAGVRTQLDARYPGWRLYYLENRPDPDCAQVNPNSVIVGDFNGDGLRDYAVLITYGHATVPIAFIQNGAGYKRYQLIVVDPRQPNEGNLLFAVRRGESEHVLRPHPGGGAQDGGQVRLQSDGISFAQCEAWQNTFVIRNGKVVRLWNSE